VLQLAVNASQQASQHGHLPTLPICSEQCRVEPADFGVDLRATDSGTTPSSCSRFAIAARRLATSIISLDGTFNALRRQLLVTVFTLLNFLFFNF